jgi:hypothetical protein
MTCRETQCELKRTGFFFFFYLGKVFSHGFVFICFLEMRYRSKTATGKDVFALWDVAWCLLMFSAGRKKRRKNKIK